MSQDTGRQSVEGELFFFFALCPMDIDVAAQWYANR